MRVRDAAFALFLFGSALALSSAHGQGAAEPGLPAAQALRGRAEAMAYFGFVALGDQEEFAANMDAEQRLVGEIRAKLAATSREAAPLTWASLAISLSILQSDTGDPPPEPDTSKMKPREVQRYMEKISAPGYWESQQRAAIQPVLDRLVVAMTLTETRAPAEWARAQMERAELLRMTAGRQGLDAETARAIAAAEQAALSVYTIEAYPREHLDVKCRAMAAEDDFYSDDPADYEAMALNTVDVKYTLLSEACGGLELGDYLNQGGRDFSKSARNNAISQAAVRMRTEMEGNAWRYGEIDTIALSVQHLSERQRRAYLNQDYVKGQIAAEAEAKAADLREALATTSGRDIVNKLDASRAAFLTASLSLEQAGLSQDDLARARQLRAQADRLAEATPEGAAWRDNAAMWRARAQLFDVLRRGSYPPPSPPPTVDAVVAAPIMLDQDRGFVAVKTPVGSGTLVATSLEWLREVTASDFVAIMAESNRAEEQLAAQSAARTQEIMRKGRLLSMIPVVGWFSQNAMINEITKEAEASSREAEKRYEALSQRNKARNAAARADRAAQGWTRERVEQLDRDIADFRTRFEPAWSPVFRGAAARVRVPAGGRLVILPDGLASALPIGLLRDPKTGRTLIEDYEIVYAPSLQVYAAAEKRAARGGTARLAAFALPEAISGLPYVETEARIGAAMTETPEALIDPAAGKSEVIARLAEASYWHFATHGVFDKANPRNSGLMIGETEMLTLGDLMGEPIGAPRLVLLSACETGLFDSESDPNAFIGLPTGFMQAGAAGVIASLWQVPDLSTTLLMARFYQLHMRGGLRPPAALRAAQLWLKDAARAELDGFVAELAAEGAMAPDKAAALSGELATLPADAPFASALHWGAWVFYGA